MRRLPTLLVLLALLPLLPATLARPAHAEDPPAPAPAPAPGQPGTSEPKPGEPGYDPTRIPTPIPGRVSLYAEVALDAAGDADARIEVHFHPDDYAKVKANTPDARKFLQDMRSNRADYEVAPDAKAGFDDKAHAVVMLMRELGGCKNQGEGRWALPIAPGYTLLGSDGIEGRPRAYFEETGEWDSGVKFVGRYVYLLPQGAKDANWDGDAKVLTWTLPSEPGSGPAKLAFEHKLKDRLMASVYKVYGLGQALSGQWLGKTVIRNAGGSRVTNLRVRYKLGTYSEWSGWNKYPELVPGQTVVSLYYPVVDGSIARLRSNAPVDLTVQWSYVDAAGQKQEDEETGRLVVLGINEFIFSNLVAGESFGTWAEQFNNAPLLAAWVSRNDLVIKQLAAMANRIAGGVAASESDETAGRALAACYELLRRNDFTYQHPPALVDKTISFDVRQVQNVKFPREVVRDRSGTCIDLAILYAAMINAIGLEPHLALIPGHCFPVVKAPSGKLYGIEVTGLGGGLKGGSAEFLPMLEKGTQELKDAAEDGRLYLIDVRDLWTRGVANPELDELPADILERWGIKEEGRGQPTAPGGGEAADPLPGLFQGEVTETDEEGDALSFPVRVGIDPAGPGRYTAVMRADVTLQTPGGEQKVILIEELSGERQGDGAVFRCTKRTIKNVTSDETQEATPTSRMVVRIVDGRLVGKHGNDEDGWTEFSLERVKK